MKRILVYGGRDYPDIGAVFAALDLVFTKHGPFTLVHGACRATKTAAGWDWSTMTGADAHADAWFARRATEECVISRWPADWTNGRGGGPRRNAEMLASGLDGGIEFPGGRGTADMRSRLVAAGVPIWRPAVRHRARL